MDTPFRGFTIKKMPLLRVMRASTAFIVFGKALTCAALARP